MKLIFLDIDGVLITRETCRQGYGIVDPDCVSRLNHITEVTGAKIVLSSCWRIGQTAVECRELLKKWGVAASCLDRTPNNSNEIRGQEISEWLNEYTKHRDVERFVIIDDDADMGDLLPNLVQTTFEHGLTEDKASEVVERLV